MQSDSPPEVIQGIFPFLKAYPFPAWISPPAQGLGSRNGVSLEPVWSNPAFDSLLGSHEALVNAIGVGEALVGFGSWLEAREELHRRFGSVWFHRVAADFGLGRRSSDAVDGNRWQAMA